MIDNPENGRDEFTAMNAATTGEQRRKRPILQRGVVKRQRLVDSQPVHLQAENQGPEEGVEFFEPIYEGDLIVGVMHKCVCGRTSELRFEYGDPNKVKG